MAIKLFKVDNFYYGIHQEFLIDEKEDLEQIEIDFNCGLGDKAFVPDGTVYVRHSDEFEGELWEEETAEVSSGGAIVAYVSYDEDEGIYTLDKTAGELKEAVLSGKYMQIEYHLGEDFLDGIYVWPVCNCYFDSDEPPVFSFDILNMSGDVKTFSCSSSDDFPVCETNPIG